MNCVLSRNRQTYQRSVIDWFHFRDIQYPEYTYFSKHVKAMEKETAKTMIKILDRLHAVFNRWRIHKKKTLSWDCVLCTHCIHKWRFRFKVTRMRRTKRKRLFLTNIPCNLWQLKIYFFCLSLFVSLWFYFFRAIFAQFLFRIKFTGKMIKCIRVKALSIE